MICQIFVQCLLWHFVDHSGPKVSANAVLTLDTGIKQSPLVQDPGCTGGASSPVNRFSAWLTVQYVRGHCPWKILRN